MGFIMLYMWIHKQVSFAMSSYKSMFGQRHLLAIDYSGFQNSTENQKSKTWLAGFADKDPASIPSTFVITSSHVERSPTLVHHSLSCLQKASLTIWNPIFQSSMARAILSRISAIFLASRKPSPTKFSTSIIAMVPSRTPSHTHVLWGPLIPFTQLILPSSQLW